MNRHASDLNRVSDLRQKEDHEIDFSDIPELDEAFFKNAVMMFRGKPVKQQVTAKFDYDVLAWFKAQGPGYQARMNAVLRAYYLTQKDKGGAA
jgi:uncharacterized protein (DUF4415 family)